MRKSKFEYFVNAVFYSAVKMIDASVVAFFSALASLRLAVIKLFLPKKLRAKFNARLQATENYRASVRQANSIFGARQLMRILCLLVFMSVLVVVMPVFYRIQKLPPEITPLEILIAIIIGLLTYIPIFRPLREDISAQYFEAFDRKDKDWHLKWKLITLALCVCIVGGALISFDIADLILNSFVRP